MSVPDEAQASLRKVRDALKTSGNLKISDWPSVFRDLVYFFDGGNVPIPETPLEELSTYHLTHIVLAKTEYLRVPVAQSDCILYESIV